MDAVVTDGVGQRLDAAMFRTPVVNEELMGGRFVIGNRVPHVPTSGLVVVQHVRLVDIIQLCQ